jgi:hypothetical protein
LAGSPAKSLTIPNTVAPPTFRCTSAWRYKSSLDETVEVDSLLEMRPHVAFGKVGGHDRASRRAHELFRLANVELLRRASV